MRIVWIVVGILLLVLGVRYWMRRRAAMNAGATGIGAPPQNYAQGNSPVSHLLPQLRARPVAGPEVTQGGSPGPAFSFKRSVYSALGAHAKKGAFG